MTTGQSAQEANRRWLPLAVLALWLHLFWSVSPIWRNGEYYQYGWYVPVLALWFFLRRWREARDEPWREVPVGWVAAVALGLLPFLMAVRAVGYFDADWRLPLLAQAAVVVAVTHALIAWARGAKVSWALAPVTLFALSAVPYPWQIEQAMIRRLTGTVISLAGEWFNLFGRPVEVVGETLESMGTVVEVTEGCSGIRSMQNLVMASLFFGELFRLGWLWRVALLGVGVLAAVLVNAGRAMVLAAIRFDHGSEAFDAAHDTVGFAAFGVSAVILLLAALAGSRFSWLRGKRRRVVVVRREVASS
jgi:exosortase